MPRDRPARTSVHVLESRDCCGPSFPPRGMGILLQILPQVYCCKSFVPCMYRNVNYLKNKYIRKIFSHKPKKSELLSASFFESKSSKVKTKFTKHPEIVKDFIPLHIYIHESSQQSKVRSKLFTPNRGLHTCVA